jgi:hypothetical protein
MPTLAVEQRKEANMNTEETFKPALFEGRQIRKAFHEDEWWFSINNVVEEAAADGLRRYRNPVPGHPVHTLAQGGAAQAPACQDGQGASRRDRELAMHYNLDVIISVGYRVKSLRGTPFRIWATQQLRSYLVKGFALAADTWRGAVLLR